MHQPFGNTTYVLEFIDGFAVDKVFIGSVNRTTFRIKEQDHVVYCGSISSPLEASLAIFVNVEVRCCINSQIANFDIVHSHSYTRP